MSGQNGGRQQNANTFLPIVSKGKENLMKIGAVVIGAGFVVVVSMLIAQLVKVS